MLYRDSADNEEWIWNSRDGVTPYCVTSRAGLEARHAEWHRDHYDPKRVPEVGDRIFVDLTIERARERRIAYVDHWWDKSFDAVIARADGDRLRDRYASKTEAVESLALADLTYGGGGAPDLIEVTPEIAEDLRRKRLAAAAVIPLETLLRDSPSGYRGGALTTEERNCLNTTADLNKAEAMLGIGPGVPAAAPTDDRPSIAELIDLRETKATFKTMTNDCGILLDEDGDEIGKLETSRDGEYLCALHRAGAALAEIATAALRWKEALDRARTTGNDDRFNEVLQHAAALEAALAKMRP